MSRRSRTMVLLWCLGAAAAVGGGPAFAASMRAVRVGPAPQLPARASAVGALAPATPLHVTVALAPRDPAALAGYATAVATPGSGVYHDYLTVAQFARRFGPTSEQSGAVRSALRAQGLDPGPVSANGLAVGVSASAAQLERAFSIGLQRVALPSGRTAFTNTAAPSLAASVAGYVQGVVGLETLAVPQPVALARTRSSASPRLSTEAAMPHVITGGPQPCPTASAAAGNAATTYTPDQLASAYGFSSLYAAGDQGAGQTVALYELEANFPTDITAYQAGLGTTASVTYQRVDGGPPAPRASHGDGTETELDIENLVALAPKANVVVYQGPNSNSGASGSGPYDTYNAIITQDTAKVISTSWGVCEPQGGSSSASAEHTLFEEAAVQGQTVLAAAGDNGSEDCASKQLAVDDPGSQPFVTSVGGTRLGALGPPTTETVWNGLCQGTPCGGGVGISSVWPMPSYQSAAPAALDVVNSGSSRTPCGAVSGSYCREVPDVSADADPSTGYLIYWNGNGLPTDTSAWRGIGGTSAATPLWAALIALTNASSSCAGTRIGFLNPNLYNVAASDYTATFNDVTSGNNDITGAGGGLFAAGPRYDMASGLGTPNGASLPAALCTAAKTAPPVTTTTTPSTTPTTTTPVPTTTATPNLGVGDPGEQTSTVGRPARLQMTASAAAGTTAYYAAGLPAGLSMNAATGVISGTPTKPGRYLVAIAAADVRGRFGGTGFRWTIAGAPTTSDRALTGIANGHPTLTFKDSAGQDGPPVAALEVSLPSGLHFAPSGKRLIQGIVVRGPGGKRGMVAARVRDGTLTITLGSAITSAQVIIAFPALRVSAVLAARARRHRVKGLTVVLAATDTSGQRTAVSVNFKP